MRVGEDKTTPVGSMASHGSVGSAAFCFLLCSVCGLASAVLLTYAEWIPLFSSLVPCGVFSSLLLQFAFMPTLFFVVYNLVLSAALTLNVAYLILLRDPLDVR